MAAMRWGPVHHSWCRRHSACRSSKGPVGPQQSTSSKSILCIPCIPCADKDDKMESKWSQRFLQILLICSLIRLKLCVKNCDNVEKRDTWRNVKKCKCDLWRDVKGEALTRRNTWHHMASHGITWRSEYLSAERLFAYVSQWHARPCSWDLRCVQQRRPQRRGTWHPGGTIDAAKASRGSRPHLQVQWRGYVGCYPCRRLPWPSSCKPQIISHTKKSHPA